jgi:hypothetical protein
MCFAGISLLTLLQVTFKIPNHAVSGVKVERLDVAEV